MAAPPQVAYKSLLSRRSLCQMLLSTSPPAPRRSRIRSGERAGEALSTPDRRFGRLVPAKEWRGRGGLGINALAIESGSQRVHPAGALDGHLAQLGLAKHVAAPPNGL